MADEPGHVRVECQACGSAQVIDDKLLATEFPCDACKETIDAGWGEPVAELPAPSEESMAEENVATD